MVCNLCQKNLKHGLALHNCLINVGDRGLLNEEISTTPRKG